MTSRYVFAALILLGTTGCSLFSEPKIDVLPIANEPIIVTPDKEQPTLSATCVDQQEGVPVITSASATSGPIGTKLEITGCNFAGFEGDKNVSISNSEGATAVIYGDEGSTAKLLKITLISPVCKQDTSYSGLPCTEWLTLDPGAYTLYTKPWGKKSNEITFTIVQSAADTSNQGTPAEDSTAVRHPSWKKYQDQKHSFWLMYPEDFDVSATQNTASGDTDNLESPVFTATFPANYSQGNNLRSATVFAGAKKVSAEECQKIYGNPVSAYTIGTKNNSSATLAISGTTFHVATVSEGAAGNFYETKRYSTMRGDWCYQLSLVAHSTNLDIIREDQPTIVQYNFSQLEKVFDQIVQNFKFVE
jgi:hypothetical protein